MLAIEDSSKSNHGKPNVCHKTEDLIELNASLGFWLKPISKINISVALPCTKQTGQCIGTMMVINRLKSRIKPYSFKTLKVLKSTLELLRFEAELESKSIMDAVIAKLDRTSLKLTGFDEEIKVKAAKVKLTSSRHEWETYFQNDPSMDKDKPGLRADTIVLKNLPIEWFGGDQPKPHILLDVFQTFGDIRRYHIPCLDPTPDDPETDLSFKRFNFAKVKTFDAFIMYREYIGFVKAMDGLMAKKLVVKLDQIGKYLEYEFSIDFDKTKHLSDRMAKKRTLLRRYGLKDAKELMDFKEHAKKEKLLYDERFKLLKDRTKRAENVFKLLLNGVEKEVKAKKQAEELRKEAERIAKKLAEVARKEAEKAKKEAEEAKREAERLARKIAEDAEKERQRIAEEKRLELKRKSSFTNGPALKSIAISLTKQSKSIPNEPKSNPISIKSIAVPLIRVNNSEKRANNFAGDNRRNNFNSNNNLTNNPRFKNRLNIQRLEHKDDDNRHNSFPSQSSISSISSLSSSSFHNRSHQNEQRQIIVNNNEPEEPSVYQPSITINVPDQQNTTVVRNVQNRKLKRKRNLLIQVTWKN